MDTIFRFFSIFMDVIVGHLFILMSGPLLYLMAYLVLFIIIFKRYQKKRSKSALLILLTLVVSIVSSITLELLFTKLHSVNNESLVLTFRIVQGGVLIILAYCTYLACKQNIATLGLDSSTNEESH